MDDLLLAWYARTARDLPWRRTRDPYAILVSEIMLQQTQVDRVVPRYLEWLERWPTPEALAAASPAEVIRAWQGCPSRGRRYEPARRQSRFEGSFRQRRAAALRLVAEAPRPLAELDSEAVAALERDALVRVDHGVVSLPE